MKKIAVLFITLMMVFPFILTGCSGDGDYESTLGTKPMTINLYGITGETTTAEAIAAVQEELNDFTESRFKTHVVLHLYTEDEYYDIIEEKIASIQEQKAKEEYEANLKKEQDKTGQTSDEETTAEGEEEAPVDEGASSFPAERENQFDIFMVQGSTRLNKYKKAGVLASLSESMTKGYSKSLSKYISTEMIMSVTLGGKVDAKNISISGGDVYGIPNNNVVGEYTYLLVNKKLANKYHYSSEDVATLDDLANYLDDVSKNDKEYITLYNEPPQNNVSLIDKLQLIGGMTTTSTHMFTKISPQDLLSGNGTRIYWSNLYDFRSAGYIVKGDEYSLPTDKKGNEKKVAAAFIKGDASLPKQYEEDYFVITYQLPIATAEECPGTMFCVSSTASNVDRCMEIISALQKDSSFRNTFQYGIEGVNYKVDEATGMVKYINDTYSMKPENTGNIFILKPNDQMSEKMLKFAENDWELGKQQYRDTIITSYSLFDFRIVTEENYKTDSLIYLKQYEEAYNAAKKAQGKKFNPSEFKFDAEYEQEYTDVIIAELIKVCDEYAEKINSFKGYDDDGNKISITSYIRNISNQLKENEYYKMFVDENNPDAPLTQYENWYKENGPKEF